MNTPRRPAMSALAGSPGSIHGLIGMSIFDVACEAVLAEEGELSTDPSDPGNWTGGKCGIGKCIGTKYGISSRSYPSLDIHNLTKSDALAIYRRDFWDKISGDQLPAPVAIMVFDAAINQGLPTAISILQTAAGCLVDGRMGPATLAACGRKTPIALLTEIAALRALAYCRTGKQVYQLGWFRRLARVLVAALAI
jgi:lysozyme family protein